MMRWLPLSKRGKDGADFLELAEGVPEYLAASLGSWIAKMEERLGDKLASGQVVERLLRVSIPDQHQLNPVTRYWHGAITDETRLDIIDLLLALGGNEYFGSGVQYAHLTYRNYAHEKLEDMLASGGSAWRVVEDNEVHSLARRVDETAQRSRDKAVALGGDASTAIARAWSACYGRSPNYDEAYRQLVLAVEAVILPITIPKDGSGTLGKAIAHIKVTTESWSIGSTTGSGDTLLRNLELIWTNQERHAKNDGTIRGVSKAEAETALATAIAIIHWTHSGLVTKA